MNYVGETTLIVTINRERRHSKGKSPAPAGREYDVALDKKGLCNYSFHI